ncbi:MAG: GAF domain-containing protein [Chloroflexia bacterium]
MERENGPEQVRILRGLVWVRLALIFPLLFVAFLDPSCHSPAVIRPCLLLLTMAAVPTALYFLRRAWAGRPLFPSALTLFDFLMTTLLVLFSSRSGLPPVFYPLYFLVALEAACWWGWAGALLSGAVGGSILSWLYTGTEVIPPAQRLLMIALTLAWPVVLGYFVQWALRQWRERRRMASWLAGREEAARQVQDHLDRWYATWSALRQAASPQELLRIALQEALQYTASSLGLVALRDPQGTGLRAECWQGFALPDAGRTTLRRGERLPTSENGGPVEVCEVLEAPLIVPGTLPEEGPADLGRIVVARPTPHPYRSDEEQRLRLLSGYAATLLENRFLRGQLTRLREETDGLLLAAGMLSSLPDPAAAMEVACRSVLERLRLEQVAIFLYAGEGAGCRAVIYPAGEETRTVTLSLPGKGLRLLQRLLDSGTSLILNRRGEMPELFETMGWGPGIQAVACFPLHVLHHRWGLLFLLSGSPNAFPAQTQQHLALFSGEIALALENYYLRQVVGGTAPL